MPALMRGEVFSSEISVSDAELSARIGRSVTSSDADVSRAIKDILAVSNMRFVAARVKILSPCDGVSRLECFSAQSAALSKYFEGSGETFMFMITLGAEVDRLIAKKRALSITDGFLYDAVASAIIESAADIAEKKISGEEKTKNRFSPGYADCPLALQRDFMSVLSADKYIGIKLLDSLLMVPTKSVSAFVAII